MKRRPLKCARNMTPTIKELDSLWSKAVKLRAGMKSEYPFSGGRGYLQSHHLVGKPTLSLRYNLDNGVCITQGQHYHIAHSTGRAQQFKEWALKHRGVTEETLTMRKYNRIDKFLTKYYLQSIIKELEGKAL